MNNSTFKQKKIKCRICKAPFTQFRLLQAVCLNIECCVQYGRQIAAKKERARAKQERREIATRKEKLKTRSDWLKDAQIEFNRFIRSRDDNLPCISCGRSSRAKVNAGHFLSVGSHPHLRFNEKNVHKQCEHCNTYLSGNIHQYRPNLIVRIGLVDVEALESDQGIAKWSIDDLRAIKAEYTVKLKALLKERENTPPQ